MSEVARRNSAVARIWTTHKEPILPADLADDLTGRGFVPGVTDAAGTEPARSATGLAEMRLTVDGVGVRFLSLSSSRGDGAVVRVETHDELRPLPNHPAARPISRRGGVVYVVEAQGPSNSDRNLCENLAEAIMERVDGLVEIGGRGTKGNRPAVYVSPWLGIFAH